MPMIGMAVGGLLCGMVFLRATGWLIRRTRVAGEAKRAVLRRQKDFRRKVLCAHEQAVAAKAYSAWKDWRQFVVAAIVDEASDVKSFYFTPADGRILPPYLPGQYLTLRLPRTGTQNPLVRCYSLSDLPHEDYYRCTVKRVGTPAGRDELAPGRASGFLHNAVHVGDLVEAKAPHGEFTLNPYDSSPVVLIAGGIGVTPLLPMLRAIVQAGSQREVYFFLGVRNSREHIFRDQLRAAARSGRVRLSVCYSQPLAGDERGRDYDHRGRIDLEFLRRVLPSSNFDFFVCGPGDMMRSIITGLAQWAVPDRHVHFEAFGPASVVRCGTAPGRAADSRCDVTFGRQGLSLTWDGSHPSLLEFAEAHGARLESGCRAGSCGQCIVAVNGGAVATLKPPGISVPKDHCLTCISVPAGNLVLDV